MRTITLPSEVDAAQAIFVSHSGGKDSQALLAALIRLGLRDKLVVVHADLGEMEWEPMHEWIESNAFGLPVHVVRAELDFFTLADKHKRLPSGMQQFCTDHLKTKPITQFIHRYMGANGLTHVINATGMRAEESKRRAGKLPFTLSKGDGTSDMMRPKLYPVHTIHDWLPLFDFTTFDVYAEIKAAGQVPHAIYAQGFSRLSCVFCVNGRKAEHEKAATMRPELARKVAELERRLGKTIRTRQVKGVKVPHYFDEYLTIEETQHA
jgi:3'-phosphoadenosine 5'-phosphosulfate sulfotransferase (PAPS reductase)/FAD synthetase